MTGNCINCNLPNSTAQDRCRRCFRFALKHKGREWTLDKPLKYHDCVEGCGETPVSHAVLEGNRIPVCRVHLNRAIYRHDKDWVCLVDQCCDFPKKGKQYCRKHQAILEGMI